MTATNLTDGDMTATDLTAGDVAWDLESLLPEAGESGVKALLDDADALARELAKARGKVAQFDATQLAGFMTRLAELFDAVGRADNYAGLMFSVDTTDPVHGALMQRVEERATAITTTLVFFELEWAARLRRARRRRCSPTRSSHSPHTTCARRAGTGRTCSPSPKKWCSPRRRSAAAARGQRLFEEQVSAITIDLDGNDVPLESGLVAAARRPDRDVRRTAAEAVTAGLAPGLRTRAFVFNTLLADKATDDRLRRYRRWIASRNLSNEASDESVEALVDAVQAPLRHPAALVRAQGPAARSRTSSPTTTAWRRWPTTESEFGWNEAQELVLDAYASFSPELADAAQRFFDELDRRAGRARASARVRSARTRCRRTTRTCCSTGRRGGATCSRSHTSSGHGAARVPRARRRACSTRPRRSRWPRPRRCSARRSRSGGCSTSIDDPQERLALLAREPRGPDRDRVPADRDEPVRGPRAHRAVASRASCRSSRFGDYWARDADRDARRRGRAHRGLPHVVVVHPALHRDARLRVRLRVRSAARAVGVPRVREAGRRLRPALPRAARAPVARRRPRSSVAIVGVDLADPEFWDGGLDIVERRLEETEQAARDAGRI